MKNLNPFKSTEKKLPIFPLIAGILVSYAITCILFIVCALLLRYTGFNESNVPMFVTVTCILSVLVAGFDAARGAEHNGWLWGLIAGAVYAVILILIGSRAVDSFAIDMRSIVIVILCIAGGGLGGVVGINLKRKK